MIQSFASRKSDHMKGVGHVYIIEFADGLTKIGRSKRDPEGRLKSHIDSVKHTGNTELNRYISMPIDDHEMVESQLISMVSDYTTGNSREWCKGVDFDGIVSWIKNVEKILSPHQHEDKLFAEKLTIDDIAEYYSTPGAIGFVSDLALDMSLRYKHQWGANGLDEKQLQLAIVSSIISVGIIDTVRVLDSLTGDVYSDKWYVWTLISWSSKLKTIFNITNNIKTRF